MTLYINTNPSAARITPAEQYRRISEEFEELAQKKISEKLIDEITKIVLKYLTIPQQYTLWFDSLIAIGALPELMYPLPKGTLQKLESNSPLHCNKKSLSETHALVYIPRGLGTLQQFRTKIALYLQRINARPYLEACDVFCYEYRDRASNRDLDDDFEGDDSTRIREFRNMPFGPSHWELFPNEVPKIEGLFMKTYSINKIYAVKYQKASLTNTLAVMWLYYIGTGKDIYQPNESSYMLNCQRVEWINVKIPVKERIGGNRVVIKYYSDLNGSLPDVTCERDINVVQTFIRGMGIAGSLM